MLTCIACSKQVNGRSLHEQEEAEAVASPSGKNSIKALTAQVMEQSCLVAQKLMENKGNECLGANFLVKESTTFIRIPGFFWINCVFVFCFRKIFFSYLSF